MFWLHFRNLFDLSWEDHKSFTNAIWELWTWESIYGPKCCAWFRWMDL